MISYKKILFVFFLILLGGVVIFLRGNDSENSVFSENELGSSEQSPVVAETEIEPVVTEKTTDEKSNTKEVANNDDSDLCENADEIVVFEKPIPIVWESKFSGCVESCYGGTFDVTAGNEKYPAFLGYPVNDEEMLRKMLDAESIQRDTILKVTGKLTAIDPAYANTLFGGKCVPNVDIERIDVLQK